MFRLLERVLFKLYFALKLKSKNHTGIVQKNVNKKNISQLLKISAIEPDNDANIVLVRLIIDHI